MPRPRITKDMLEVARDRGWSRSQTAKHYGMHHTSIEAASERLGVVLPMHKFSPTQVSARSKTWTDTIKDAPRKKKKSTAIWSASPEAVERALEKLKRDKRLQTMSNNDK